MNLGFLIVNQIGALQLVPSADYNQTKLAFAVMLMVWGADNIMQEWVIVLTADSVMASDLASDGALIRDGSERHEAEDKHKAEAEFESKQHAENELQHVIAVQPVESPRELSTSDGDGLLEPVVQQQQPRHVGSMNCTDMQDMDVYFGLWVNKGSASSSPSVTPSEQGQAAFLSVVCAAVIGAGCILLAHQRGGWLALAWWIVFALLDGIWYV